MDGPTFSNTPNASVGSRIAGYLIDLVIIVVVSFIPVAGWIAAPASMLTRDALPFLDGQSIGKKLVGIRAVDKHGAALTNKWEPALIRNVVLFIPLFPFVELIVLLTNKDILRLGDQWAHTRVVNVN